MAAAMGIDLLTEEEYRELQKLGEFDTKTSSWVKTPSSIRKLGGACFVIAASTRFSCITTVPNLTMPREGSVGPAGVNFKPVKRFVLGHSVQPRSSSSASGFWRLIERL
jgi:hypothetical protein